MWLCSDLEQRGRPVEHHVQVEAAAVAAQVLDDDPELGSDPAVRLHRQHPPRHVLGDVQ